LGLNLLGVLILFVLPATLSVIFGRVFFESGRLKPTGTNMFRVSLLCAFLPASLFALGTVFNDTSFELLDPQTYFLVPRLIVFIFVLVFVFFIPCWFVISRAAVKAEKSVEEQAREFD